MSKSNKPYEYRFTISDAFTPKTLPMARLADYLAELALLLGERERVHFSGLKAGSAVVVADVEPQAVPKVRERLHEAEMPDAPADVARHYRKLNDMLRDDNAKGALQEGEQVVVHFPGREAPTRVGPVTEEGELVGVLVRIGGTAQTVHAAILAEGRTHNCDLSPELARRMAPCLFGPPLRVLGTGWWYRLPKGEWELERFRIRDFEELHDESLLETVERLRAVQGSEWAQVEDPWVELHRIRYGEEPGS
jgi:hypothetical protein